MTNLTEASYYSRKGIKIGAIAIVVFLVLRFSFGMIIKIIQQNRQPEEPPPTTAFGKLPPVVFPEVDDPLPLNFKLETVNGTLPGLADQGRVYFLPKNTYAYLTLEKAQEKAQALGFGGQPVQLKDISETTYRWQKGEGIYSYLTMEIVDQNFNLRYEYGKDQSLLGISQLTTQPQALTVFKNFLEKANFLTEDLEKGQAEYLYYRFAAPALIQVNSLSELDFIRVNLLRKDVNKLPVLPPHPKKANVSALISKANDPTKRIIELNYTHFPIDYEVWGTYPLKTTTQAWDELKKGLGYVAELGDNESGFITVRNIYLAYYDPHIYQNYLQPIFVFKGDRGFLAYVPAISNEWIEVKNP
jgi:hypothetical protein